MADSGTEYFVGKSFEDESVETDSCEFRNCRFTDCRLVYKGSARPGAFYDCEFTRCGWELADEAANTVKFLMDLFATPFRPSIEEILRNITASGDETHRGPWKSSVH